MYTFHVPRQGLGLEELVALGAVHPGHGVLGRARPPCVRQGHVGGLARGPQSPGGGGGRGGGGEDGPSDTQGRIA